MVYLKEFLSFCMALPSLYVSEACRHITVPQPKIHDIFRKRTGLSALEFHELEGLVESVVSLSYTPRSERLIDRLYSQVTQITTNKGIKTRCGCGIQRQWDYAYRIVDTYNGELQFLNMNYAKTLFADQFSMLFQEFAPDNPHEMVRNVSFCILRSRGVRERYRMDSAYYYAQGVRFKDLWRLQPKKLGVNIDIPNLKKEIGIDFRKG